MAVSPAAHAPPLPMHVPYHACMPNPSPLSWTEFLTHACENIIFPQLLLQQIGAPLPLDPPLLSVFDIDLVLVCKTTCKTKTKISAFFVVRAVVTTYKIKKTVFFGCTRDSLSNYVSRLRACGPVIPAIPRLAGVDPARYASGHYGDQVRYGDGILFLFAGGHTH